MNNIKALAQHLDIDYFDFNEETYTGATLEDFNSFSGADYKEIDEIETDNKHFINWLEENCTLLTDEITVSTYDVNLLEYSSEEYLVVDDSEADNLWDQSLDNYLEEYIYPDLPSNMKSYFDEEKWKWDARYDGRGHSLSSYDGNENEETVEDETFYIYRIN